MRKIATKRLNFPVNSGQSIVEVIIAVSIFIIISGSAVITILGSLIASRLAEEETQATLLAYEGLDAVESIRNRNFSSLSDGTHGLSSLSGFWEFNGTNDTQGKFTREVNVLSVDSDTKEIASIVSWSFVPSKISQVEITSRLTNWQEAEFSVIPTSTPSPTPTNTPPPPVINSCDSYCIANGYVSGVCRGTINQCTSNGEVYQSGGDVYCTGGKNADTCCCRP